MTAMADALPSPRGGDVERVAGGSTPIEGDGAGERSAAQVTEAPHRGALLDTFPPDPVNRSHLVTLPLRWPRLRTGSKRRTGCDLV